MELKLVRKKFTNLTSIGVLLMDGKLFCATLEDKCRQIYPDGTHVKIPKETAIPYGKYEVVINFSNRFQKEMPLLLDVPKYTGVRIHIGNTDKDTEGCILLGFYEGKDYIGQSKAAFTAFMVELRKALKKGKVWITITNGQTCA